MKPPRRADVGDRRREVSLLNYSRTPPTLHSKLLLEAPTVNLPVDKLDPHFGPRLEFNLLSDACLLRRPWTAAA